MAEADRKKWIFGLSIDESISWVAAAINADTGEFYESELFGGLFDDNEQSDVTTFEESIEINLKKLKTKYPKLFKECAAVGISSIGIIDTYGSKLISIARKNWSSSSNSYLVDFSGIMSRLFENKYLKVTAQNDATAKCLAEYYWLHRRLENTNSDNQSRVDSLCLAMFNEGVNGGFVRGNPLKFGAPVAQLLHQELGHVFPPIHPSDANLILQKDFGSRISGCPVHHVCFEGLASWARVRNQWGRPLIELEHHPDQPWQIISYYIAHFCWNVVLAGPPQKIMLGGSLAFEGLIPLVKDQFEKLNKGQGEKPYIRYDELMGDSFFEIGRLKKGAGRAGALELARREALGARARVGTFTSQINKL